MKVRYIPFIKIKSTAVSRLAPNFEFALIFLDTYPSTRSDPIEKRNSAYMAIVISWLKDQIKCGRANKRSRVIALGIESLSLNPASL